MWSEKSVFGIFIWNKASLAIYCSTLRLQPFTLQAVASDSTSELAIINNFFVLPCKLLLWEFGIMEYKEAVCCCAVNVALLLLT